MIVSHYQKKKLYCSFAGRPQPPSGKIDGPLLLPGIVTTSATISNGRCADWMEKAELTESSWHGTAVCMHLSEFVCYDLWRWGPSKPSWTKRLLSIGCAIWAATIDLHDCATTILLLVPMVHQKYISSPYQNVCPGSWYLFLSPKRILQTSASVALFTV
jgi:hypothetical protein